MKTIAITLLSLALITLSCSGEAPSAKQKMETLVDNYMQEQLKNEMNKNPEMDGSIILDSIEVFDTITQKKKIGYEILELKKQAEKLIEEGKELAKEYQNKKDLYGMYSEVAESEDSYSNSLSHDLEELKSSWEEKSTEGNKLVSLISEKTEKYQKADSIKPLYYHVFSYFTAKDNKINKKEQITLPFHISTDFMIIKEPKEFLKED